MILRDRTEQLYKAAFTELKSRFKRKLVTTASGKKYWAEPNFQECVFSVHQTKDWISLGDGYILLFNEHQPFYRKKEYIVTYQIGLKNDFTTLKEPVEKTNN